MWYQKSKNSLWLNFKFKFMYNKILAKSNGKTLIEHSIECMKNAEDICNQLGIGGKLKEQAMFAALFHDIGKCTAEFQEHLSNSNKKLSVPHNYISGYFIKNYIEKLDPVVLKAILYHHPLLENDTKKFNGGIDDDDLDLMKGVADYLFSEFKNTVNSELFNSNDDLTMSQTLDITRYPYFENDSMGNNPQSLLVTNIVRMSDILASSKNDVFPFNNVYDNSFEIVKPEKYDSERFNNQVKLSEDCFNTKDSLINAITGFGKTMVGLLYILKSEHKGYWVCPRTIIAEGVYKNIMNELSELGLDQKVSVSLLINGKYVYGDDDSRIVVTNLDNFFNPNISTKYNERCLDMFKSNVVFDEFHEYLSEDAIMAGFMTVLSCRNLYPNVKTLYMSATPIHCLYNILGDNNAVEVFPKSDMPLFGQDKKVKITFSDTFSTKDKMKGINHLISVPTVKSAQMIYNEKITDECYHAQFTASDRKSKIDQLYNTHGKDCVTNDSYVSTNALSTGLNVSFDNMTIITPTPERLLQVGGRVNRYGIRELSEYNILTSKALNGKLKSDKCFLEKSKPLNGIPVLPVIDAWLSFLKKYVEEHGEDGVLYLKDLYTAREEFYVSKEGRKVFSNYFSRILNKSFDNLALITYSYSAKKIDVNDDSVTIVNKPSLRASNDAIFVKVYDIVTKKIVDEPIQFTIGTFGVNKSNLQDVVDDAVKYIDSLPSSDNPYYNNKYLWENMKKKNSAKMFERLFDMAKNSNTPFFVSSSVLAYTKTIGIFGVK